MAGKFKVQSAVKAVGTEKSTQIITSWLVNTLMQWESLKMRSLGQNEIKEAE